MDAFSLKADHKMSIEIDKTKNICKECAIGIDYKYATNEQKADRMRKTFDKYVIRNGEYCWKWKGCITPGGYSAINVYRKKEQAHRVSWMIYKGEIPDGMFVCHRCSNRECTNPEHLFIGTHQDNMKDMLNKGRKFIKSGSKYNFAKLNEKKIIKIMKMIHSRYSDRQISEQFNVTRPTITNIRNRKAWKHVDFTAPSNGVFFKYNYAKGESLPQSKLKEEDVVNIVGLLEDGIGVCEIARKFDVKHSTISSIKDGTNWKWLEVVKSNNIKRTQRSEMVGSNCPWTKLTEAKVLKIKKDLSDGIPNYIVAKTYSVTKGVLEGIKSNKTWKHVKI